MLALNIDIEHERVFNQFYSIYVSFYSKYIVDLIRWKLYRLDIMVIYAFEHIVS